MSDRASKHLSKHSVFVLFTLAANSVIDIGTSWYRYGSRFRRLAPTAKPRRKSGCIRMLNNIGPAGLFFIAIIVGLPIWLIVRASKRKSAEQARIANALETLAREKGSDTKSD